MMSPTNLLFFSVSSSHHFVFIMLLPIKLYGQNRNLHFPMFFIYYKIKSSCIEKIIITGIVLKYL